MKGIGYQEYKKIRLNEGHTGTTMEHAGNERYLIYFGRAHVADHETGVECRGHLKIGRGKFATALMRGRNQPGIDFRIYAELILENNQATKDVEEIIKDALEHRNMKFSQGQREMYNISDAEIETTLSAIVEIVEAETGHKILETNYYN
jgi:hypothetical protein